MIMVDSMKKRKTRKNPRPAVKYGDNRPAVNVRWFKDQIKKQGLSGRKIALMFGCNESVVSHLFKGRRQMRLDEAPKWAEILRVPLNEVLLNAGVFGSDNGPSYGLGASTAPEGPLVEVTGALNGDFVVKWGRPPGPGHVENPLGAVLSGKIGCLRSNTSGGKLSGVDGALLYYELVPSDFFDHEGMGRLCLVSFMSHEGPKQAVRVLKRGYEPGRHNLALLSGLVAEENVVVLGATPILWMKL
jgi:transcriptional regulator with XRE-family HTH domain